MHQHKRVDDTAELPEGRPSKLCKQTFLSRPDFWVVIGVILAVTGGVYAYAITYEGRMTKCESKIENIEQTNRAMLGLLESIDKKVTK